MLLVDLAKLRGESSNCLGQIHILAANWGMPEVLHIVGCLSPACQCLYT